MAAASGVADQQRLELIGKARHDGRQREMGDFDRRHRARSVSAARQRWAGSDGFGLGFAEEFFEDRKHASVGVAIFLPSIRDAMAANG